MKYISLMFICVISLLIVGCSPMDDTYKDFDKDGPILYLTKIPRDSILVQGGWHRIQLSIPEINDSRSSQVFVIWNNGKDSLRTNLNPTGRTEVLLDNMREGSFIITCRVEDNDGNKSLNTDVQGMTYGEIYKSYLRNRVISKQEFDGKDYYLKFSNLTDSTAVASVVTWQKNGKEETRTFFYDETNTIILEDFSGTSFKTKTLFQPEKNALELIESNEEKIPSVYLMKRDYWTVTTSHSWAADSGINGAPECLIDGNSATGLNMPKPGIETTPAGAILSFIIDMKYQASFNYFYIVHRTSNTAEGLRIWGISLYGSNNNTTYEKIQENVDVPYSGVTSATVKLNTLHSYRYVKVVYEKFSTTANNNVQIMEFNLGLD